MLLLYIFGPIGFVIALIFGLRKLYLRWKEGARGRRIGQEIEELLARAEQGDLKAQDKLVDRGFWSTNPTRKERLEANKKIVEARRGRQRVQAEQEKLQRDWEGYGEPATTAHTAWQGAVGTKEEPALFVAFVRAYDHALTSSSLEETRTRLLEELGLNIDDLKIRLQQLVLDRYEMLVPQMQESEPAFSELRLLIPQTREKDRDFSKAGVKPLRYPDNWNKAVARFIENPHVEDFVRGRDPEPGQLRLWGEKAWLGDDIVMAKLVLAYASYRSDWREELGDVLTDKLGVQAVEYHNSLTGAKPA